jgi:hypothetical protein
MKLSKIMKNKNTTKKYETKWKLGIGEKVIRQTNITIKRDENKIK